MPQIGKENFLQAFRTIYDGMYDHRAQFVKKGQGEYFFDPSNGHVRIARNAGISGIPLDGGKLTADPINGILYVHDGSIDFEINADNPERAATIADFQGFAQGTEIEVRS
ncbi:hypothetical protein HY407_04590 [Candidatus Gottesmanbacteria bacterium]|nr:hypothetical protein [Candidatus Gottesmanbacteria bacterium]